MQQRLTNAVKAIKNAILESQLRAAKGVNKEQLSLYFGIGRYISEHSRKGFWGTGAIEQISESLQKELPGLRGFSSENIKKMRRFYEEWQPCLNSVATATEFETVQTQLLIPAKLQNSRRCSPSASVGRRTCKCYERNVNNAI